MTLTACIAQAAQTWHVPVPAIIQVIQSPHPQGIGPMGIPAAWVPFFEKYGVSRARLSQDPCANISAGAWIIAFSRALSGGTARRALERPDGQAQIQSGQTYPVTRECMAFAAKRNHIPLPLLYGILATENGTIGRVNWNRNGSYDIGPMQINSSWLPKLAAIGITRRELLDNGCLNVTVGAWILSGHMQGADPNNARSFWRHVGDYNSHTPRYNRTYAHKVYEKISMMFGRP